MCDSSTNVTDTDVSTRKVEENIGNFLKVDLAFCLRSNYRLIGERLYKSGPSPGIHQALSTILYSVYVINYVIFCR